MVSKMGKIKPLREYINDKKEMIDQMFSCVEEHQLKKMIPDVLKEAQIDDIKAECLVELLGMSRKRILGILEGKELDESSEDSLELSDISDDEIDIKTEWKSPERSKKRKEQKNSKGVKLNKKSRKDSSSEDENEDREEKSEKEVTPPKKKRPEMKKKKIEESTVKETTSKKPVKGSKKKIEVGSKEKEKQGKATNLQLDLGLVATQERPDGKNLLEILELEMRARAIRSLIEREEKKNSDKAASPKPSTSSSDQEKANSKFEVDDNDPDAVIVIDENVADQIDLTVDDSDVEELRIVVGKDNGKTADKTDNTNDDVLVISNKESEKNKFEKNSNNHCSYRKQLKSSEKEECSESNKLDLKNSDISGEFIPKNWTERWLESNEVQNVMKTTKVLTNLKKRLKNVNKQKMIEEKNSEVETQKENQVIEGTVDEYAQLPSKRKDNNENKDTENTDISGNEPKKKLSETNLTSPNIIDEPIYKVSLDELPISSDNDKKKPQSEAATAPSDTDIASSSNETENEILEKDKVTEEENNSNKNVSTELSNNKNVDEKLHSLPDASSEDTQIQIKGNHDEIKD